MASSRHAVNTFLTDRPFGPSCAVSDTQFRLRSPTACAHVKHPPVAGKGVDALMKTLLAAFIAVVVCFPSLAGGVTVYNEPVEAFADVSIYVTDVEAFADCSIYVTDVEAFADGNAVWYWENTEAFADVSVYIENTEAFADVTVYFTDVEAFAQCDINWTSF